MKSYLHRYFIIRACRIVRISPLSFGNRWTKVRTVTWEQMVKTVFKHQENIKNSTIRNNHLNKMLGKLFNESLSLWPCTWTATILATQTRQSSALPKKKKIKERVSWRWSAGILLGKSSPPWLSAGFCSEMYSDPGTLPPALANGFCIIKTLNWIPEFQGHLTHLAWASC